MRRSIKTFHTEKIVDNVYACLLNDLAPDNPNFGFRSYTGPCYDYAGPYTFKRFYQLEQFYKRIITSRDKTPEVLENESIASFVDSQKSFWLPRPMSVRQERVLFTARRICHSILGEFNLEEMAPLCTFGKKAAAFLPLRKSYLDVRMRTLNGSEEQWEWFKAVMSMDIHLHRAYREHKNFTFTGIVDIKAVPKSFKACRIIAPDTTIGGFLSRGLGDLIRKKLERGTKIRLSEQQDFHKKLAQQASIDGKLATIDMSKASDSFVMEHLYALLPDSWHSVVNVVRTSYGELPDETIIRLTSAMLMGSGHTFPLQTLLFYCLCKAVIELSGSNSNVSVYGDDIIIPSRFATRVVTCLEDCGFTINTEKSFWNGPFRESCGGDYHTGLDVRPFMLEHNCCKTTMHEFVALIHKIINGLQLRWVQEEIPSTLRYLHTLLVSVNGRINVVPDYEPIDSGIYNPLQEFHKFCSFPRVTNSILTYYKLVRKSKKRKPRKERIYYWYSLRPCKELSPYDDEVPPGSLDSRGLEAKKGSHRYSWQFS